MQRQQDSQALTEFGSDPRGGQNRADGGPLAVVGGPMARRPRGTRGPSRACGIARKSLDTPLDLTRFPTIECIYTYTTRQKHPFGQKYTDPQKKSRQIFGRRA